MSKNLYIATMEPRAGKSVVALGIMELLSRRLNKIGFFRPITPDVEQDNNIQLIRKRYNLKLSYENMYAYRHSDAQRLVAAGQYNVLLKNILTKYKELESQSDFVLCEGTDYTGVASAFEFDFNADVANNLACPVLGVVNGRGKTAREISEEIRFARESFESHGCTILSMIANRVAPINSSALSEQFKRAADAGESVYVLPEEPLLGHPTVGDVAITLKIGRAHV